MQIVYTVPQSHCVVLERFGKFSRVQAGGIRFRIPFIETPNKLEGWAQTANKRRFFIELTEQQTNTPSRQCHTKDNVPVNANASVYWKIIDVRKALYEVDVLPTAIADIALNALRSNVGSMELDKLLAERQELNQKIAGQLAETAVKWGIVFTRVEIQELTMEDDVSTAMVQQMDAERHRRATIAKAQGEAQARVLTAEAEKKAAILVAEGQAKALEMITEAEQKYLSALTQHGASDDIVQLLLAQKYIDGFATISKNPADKVFLPNSFNGMFAFSGDQPSQAQK